MKFFENFEQVAFLIFLFCNNDFLSNVISSFKILYNNIKNIRIIELSVKHIEKGSPLISCSLDSKI